MAKRADSASTIGAEELTASTYRVLMGIDRESGEVRWDRGIEANGLPVVADGRIFVNGLHGVEVFDLDGGNRLGSHTWSVREGASPGVAVVDDVCFAGGDGLRALI